MRAPPPQPLPPAEQCRRGRPGPGPVRTGTTAVEQRWRDRRARWRRPDDRVLFDPRLYGVKGIADDVTAKNYIETNHYSGSYVAAVHRFGLWQLYPEPGREAAWAGPRIAGVAVLSNPVQKKVLTNVFPHLKPGCEALELGRLVLDDSVGFNGESWLLGQVWQMALRKGVHGVVMFSDPVPRTTINGDTVFAGHLGQIYQAVNCLFLGTSTKRRLCLMKDGRVMSARAMQKIRKQEQGHRYAEQFLAGYGAPPLTAADDPAEWLARALRAVQARYIQHRGCWRYAWRLGANARERRAVEVGMAARKFPTWDAGQLPLFDVDPAQAADAAALATAGC